MKIKINLYSGETFFTSLESYEDIKELAYDLESYNARYLYSNDFIIKASDIKSIVKVVEEPKMSEPTKTFNEVFSGICSNWKYYTEAQKEKIINKLAGE
ncbi:hypothetical protein [Paenibacillus sp. Marseille-Q4541]|uniref:hypothetical protein n=1 Tax=Paenibacillus sp. Marseille-Q4541 TaxID=2831522 RepID=UPI001BAA71C1|nr:hypothetical protein [Paenibacillus sp. Marseille-Q4541]